MYILYREQIIDTSLKKAWEFIGDPSNLNAITPPDLDFRIISDLPFKIYDGLMIEYDIRIPFLGYRKWVSEIKHIHEPFSFVDEQRVGPFKLWYHYHELKEVSEGIKFTDKVYYEVPLCCIGKIVHTAFVKKMLTRIFDYRRERLMEILEQDFNAVPKKYLDGRA